MACTRSVGHVSFCVGILRSIHVREDTINPLNVEAIRIKVDSAHFIAFSSFEAWHLEGLQRHKDIYFSSRGSDPVSVNHIRSGLDPDPFFSGLVYLGLERTKKR